MAYTKSREPWQPQAGDGGGGLERGSETAGLRELSLFSGAGGGLLGSMLLGWRTVAAVEIDPYCQRVLCARGGYMAVDNSGGEGYPKNEAGDTTGPDSGERVPIDAGTHRFPVYSDVRDFHPVPGSCDIVTGGFPCQPFSQAGKRLGEDDPRNMWPHAVRVLVESGAPLGFFENVPGLLSSGYFGTVLGDLAEAGFDAEWCVLGADDVGAPHRRKRLWILAYRPGVRLEGSELQREWEPVNERSSDGRSPWWCDPADVGDARHGPQHQRPRDEGGQCGERPPVGAVASEPSKVGDAGSGLRSRRSPKPWREAEGRAAPGRTGEGDEPRPEGEPVSSLVCVADGLASGLGGCVPRVAVGVPERVNRLRALGNGQVPQCMAAAFTYLARQAGVTPSCT